MIATYSSTNTQSNQSEQWAWCY